MKVRSSGLGMAAIAAAWIAVGCSGASADAPTTGTPSAPLDGGSADDPSTDGASPDASSPSPPPPLGTITPDGTCALTSLMTAARCEQLEVRCPGLDAAKVSLLVGEPKGPERGTILLGSGSAGASPIEQAATDPKTGENAFVPELEALRALGYRIIERAWQDSASGAKAERGWFRGTEGPDASACRYATLAKYVHDRYASAGAICALGFSGGSVELALSLGRWGTGAYLDQAVFESGPVARFDDACNGGAAAQPKCDAVKAALPWECTSTPLACPLGDDITLLVDTAYGGQPVCSSRAAANATRLFGDSVLGPGSTSAYPKTALASILGMRDCASGAATGGADFVNRVTGKGGAAPRLVTVAGAGHTVHATTQGAQKIREVLAAGCTK